MYRGITPAFNAVKTHCDARKKAWEDSKLELPPMFPEYEAIN